MEHTERRYALFTRGFPEEMSFAASGDKMVGIAEAYCSAEDVQRYEPGNLQASDEVGL